MRSSCPDIAVVVSDEPYNRLSTIVVVPFSTGARAASFRPEANIRGARTRACIEQVGAVEKRRLREKFGSIAGSATMESIDEELELLLGLEY